MGNTMVSGWHIFIFLGVLALFASWIYAIVVTARDSHLSTAERAIWIVLLIVFQVFALAAWTLDRFLRRLRRGGRGATATPTP
ncbi:hypothetical protein D9V32_07140 [Mycetocola tolaasinivorans]|uniref:Cardiolipin synthase N-terminal domain-containing protein n=1 Tax=Mycetocola tolaasinivorans TaxID=76635 RepID=A0A3L7A8M6_9MICO|nr:hypothetical protein [Mycetocola tolaasinivorans]RLP75931.1 hypothetical protein D9V32_07140 [Mycetocola tolaasinivorans]